MCMFCRSLFAPLSIFLLSIVLSVLLRFMDSDYRFGIFKLFLVYKIKTTESLFNELFLLITGYFDTVNIMILEIFCLALLFSDIFHVLTHNS